MIVQDYTIIGNIYTYTYLESKYLQQQIRHLGKRNPTIYDSKYIAYKAKKKTPTINNLL